MAERGTIWQQDSTKKFGVSHTDSAPEKYLFDTKAQAEEEVNQIFAKAQRIEQCTSGIGAQGVGELHQQFNRR